MSTVGSTASKVPSYLRRYTDLPALLYLLRERKITLLDPQSWDDSNDSYYLSQYKKKKKLATVLALCFSQLDETYHHWSVFSKGSGGVCVVFNREPLFATLRKDRKISARPVQYLSLVKARGIDLETSDLPFIKRVAYKPEGEFRVIYESPTEALSSHDVDIDLTHIRSISLSPWLHKNLSAAAVETIRAVNGCGKMKVSRSTLVSNEEWKALGGKAS